MGLKVLLADDSAAITKVIQICLQDFGVEIKSVGNGKDVLDVAKSFKPDIAFIDVMLPHKPGYDVAGEIKHDAVLTKTPVIMLWSSFMEFDEAKFKKSMADGKLEKPFEAKDIREVVKKHVSKTQTQPLADFVQLPKVEFPKPKDWDMSAFDDVPKADPDSDWVRKDLGPVAPPMPTTPPSTPTQAPAKAAAPENKFKLNLNPDGEVVENTVSFQYDDSKIKDLSFLLKNPAPAVEVAPPPMPPPEIKAETASPKPQVATQIHNASNTSGPITEAEIKKLVEQEVRKLVSQIVPDLAEQLIKEEIQRLTQ